MPIGSLVNLYKKAKVTKKSSTAGPLSILASEDKPEENVQPDQEVNQILAENPGISGSTMVNVMKSKGMKIVKEGAKGIPKDKYDSCVSKTKDQADNPYALCNYSLGKKYKEWADKKKEADSSSANPQALRVQNKESAVKIKGSNITFRSAFIEASASDDGIGHTKFKVVLLQEGLGNMKDAYYYSKEALTSAIPVFEGKKIYADHPSAIEEQTRPERSVKDVLGHFEGVHIEEGDDGQSMLVADVIILADDPYRWARALMRHSVEYAKKFPDKDFVGLSINASGEAEPTPVATILESGVPDSAKVKLQKAQSEGIETIRLVKEIKDAVSCDLVTEAGAGGKVLEMLEKEINMGKKKQESKVKENEKDPKADAGGEKDPSKLAAESEGADGEKDPKAAAAGGGHDDEEQDKALIKKMITEYLGEEEANSEDMHQMCKEAYEAYVEMGYKEDEAMKAAGLAMKLAKHLAGKEKPVEEAKDADPADKKAVAADKDDAETTESDETKESESETKESENQESKSVLKLKAEIAALKEGYRKIEIEKHLDKVLRESGLPRASTTVFRDNVGAPKSVKEIDEKFKLFMESYKAARGSVTTDLPFVVSHEKQGETKGNLNFTDCVK